VEIIDYLKAARRRLALVILLPVLSMAVAAGLLLIQPATYTATATVDAPALVGGLDSQYTGAQGVNQFVSAFEATASGPVVQRAVAAEAGVSPTRLNDGLVVSQRGSSASLSADYTTDKKDTVVPVLKGITTTTLRTLFEPQVQSSKGRVDSAQATLTEATSAIDAFTTKYGMADPQKAYEAQLSRVNSLVAQQASFTAAGNSVGAAAMASPIASAKADLAKFGPVLSEYSALTTARDTAVQGLGEANAKLAANTVQLANADPSKIVFVGGVQAVDRVPQVLQTTASVGAAAFFLALVLVLILEVVRRGRAARTAEADHAEGTEASAVERPALAVHGSSPKDLEPTSSEDNALALARNRTAQRLASSAETRA
jgi:hypothetical protein